MDARGDGGEGGEGRHGSGEGSEVEACARSANRSAHGAAGAHMFTARSAPVKPNPATERTACTIHNGYIQYCVFTRHAWDRRGPYV